MRERGRWIRADPSSVLPPPVVQSLSIAGRFDTYDDLETAFPGGPDGEGIYAVGTRPPYDYYAWSLVDGLWRWDDQGRLQMPDTYLRLFREVTPSGNKISINAATTRYAKVTLSGDSVIYGLTITNATDGDEGYILVFQTGLKRVSLSKGIVGTVDLPLGDGTMAMLTYNKVGETIYIRTGIIIGDGDDRPSLGGLSNVDGTADDPGDGMLLASMGGDGPPSRLTRSYLAASSPPLTWRTATCT